MSEAKLKRTITNHEMPRVTEVTRRQADILEASVIAAPFITLGIHEVGRVGMFMHDLFFIQDTDGNLFRVPVDLKGWAHEVIVLGYARLITFPCEIMFSVFKSHTYADFVL